MVLGSSLGLLVGRCFSCAPTDCARVTHIKGEEGLLFPCSALRGWLVLGLSRLVRLWLGTGLALSWAVFQRLMVAAVPNINA